MGAQVCFETLSLAASPWQRLQGAAEGQRPVACLHAGEGATRSKVISYRSWDGYQRALRDLEQTEALMAAGRHEWACLATHPSLGRRARGLDSGTPATRGAGGSPAPAPRLLHPHPLS